jgi:NTE family protein
MAMMLNILPLLLIAVLAQAGCATATRPISSLAASSTSSPQAVAVRQTTARPQVGVAFGGGSARGLAHIGVIRWLEEHRVPIDLVAGTSMGGLIGGSFATGLDAGPLAALLTTLDWDALFGSSNFAYRNIRRKADGRAFPSHLEFGLKRGLGAPTALNNGQQVELLLTRITAPYHLMDRFDDLPTPFSAVAVDLAHASQVVLNRGSLAQAMRATMSLPLIFPPVEVDGRLLVDGGAMNNVPADVVRAMGADRVIAVNVGELEDPDAIDFTMLGVVGATVDAMMRSSTRKVIAGADVVIDVPLKEFGSLDWRRGAGLIEEGYKAADALRERLLPMALDENAYAEWKAGRQRRRRTAIPAPTFVTTEGFADGDSLRLTTMLSRHVGSQLDIATLEEDLAVLSGLDRYESISWRFVVNDTGNTGLEIRGRPKPYAPPFMMLGVNLENTTSSDFNITATARYLAYGVLTSASELRVDGTIGSDPAIGVELYTPIRSSAFFVAPHAGVSTATFNVIADDAVFARYGHSLTRAGVAVGANLGVRSDIRLNASVGQRKAEVEVGSPIFPRVSGKETAADLIWRYDGQDSPVVPTSGLLATVRASHVFENPDVIVNDVVLGSADPTTQFSATGNHFWSLGKPNRLFFAGGAGSTWGGTPLPYNQFALGAPLRLGAYRSGELYGENFYLATAGYLREIGRLPDFIGGPVFVGGWLENGDAFDRWEAATWRSNVSGGLVMDTLIGPVMLGASAGFDGRWRTYLGIGRLFQ